MYYADELFYSLTQWLQRVENTREPCVSAFCYTQHIISVCITFNNTFMYEISIGYTRCLVVMQLAQH